MSISYQYSHNNAYAKDIYYSSGEKAKLVTKYTSMKEGEPQQGMSVFLEKFQFAYISAPKCACTSVKEMLFRIENGPGVMLPKSRKGAIELRCNGRKIYVHNLYPTLEFESARKRLEQASTRVCIVRDPVERIASCHRNRVIAKNKLNAEEINKFKINAIANPDFNSFVRNLGEYRKSPHIEHHSKPLASFLGKNKKLYTDIFNMRQLGSLEKLIQQITDTQEKLEKLQVSKEDETLQAIDTETKQEIEIIYAEDYKFYGEFF